MLIVTLVANSGADTRESTNSKIIVGLLASNDQAVDTRVVLGLVGWWNAIWWW
jgi:hypothetical protein